MTKQQKLKQLNNLRARLLNAARKLQQTHGLRAFYFTWAAEIIGRKLSTQLSLNL